MTDQRKPADDSIDGTMKHGLLVLVFLTVDSALLWAHDEKVSASEVQVSKNEVVWKVDVGILGLGKVMKFPAGPAELSERQLQSMKDEIARYLRGGLALEINGRTPASEAGDLEPIYEPFLLSGEPYIARVRQEFRFRPGEEVKHLRLSLRFFSDMTTQHRAVVHVRWQDHDRQFVRVGPSDLELTYARLNPTFWNVAGDFLLWGAHHIFIGYDHIAFLLALLLGARRLRQMVLIITSFTVAHSLTLFLAAVDVIRLQQTVTEALIAASIVYVAVENYFLKDGRHRWILTFFFGLFHGLGFSSVLRERLIDVSGILVPVLAFNVGVELGQIVILLVAYPLVLWLRRGADEKARQQRERRLVWIGSLPILLLGLGWFVERVFGLEFMPL